jgi:quinoprotein dehydrogenase-associated probable ABC transporter substrate-binding protein
VAADPNNYPFSDERLGGFENKIAELLARDLGVRLQWVWRAQRRGFFRETLQEGNADLVLGVPAGFERALTTRPYYRSSYVFVSRRDRRLRISSFDDPGLRSLKIGVQLIGDDGANTPPAHALAERGLADNVVGFPVYGDYRETAPPARILDAVARGKVDVAAVWGPLAGSYARRSRVPLDITPIRRWSGRSALPVAFDIAMGVRKGDAALKEAVDRVLARERRTIERILDEYGVPRLPPES